MAKFSYATERKIKIIEEKIGSDWEEKFQGESIDSIYNRLMGDDRKNLFCKISPQAKNLMEEMLTEYEVTLGEFVERLILKEYKQYEIGKDQKIHCLKNEYSG